MGKSILLRFWLKSHIWLTNFAHKFALDVDSGDDGETIFSYFDWNYVFKESFFLKYCKRVHFWCRHSIRVVSMPYLMNAMYRSKNNPFHFSLKPHIWLTSFGQIFAQKFSVDANSWEDGENILLCFLIEIMCLKITFAEILYRSSFSMSIQYSRIVQYLCAI